MVVAHVEWQAYTAMSSAFARSETFALWRDLAVAFLEPLKRRRAMFRAQLSQPSKYELVEFPELRFAIRKWAG